MNIQTDAACKLYSPSYLCLSSFFFVIRRMYADNLRYDKLVGIFSTSYSLVRFFFFSNETTNKDVENAKWKFIETHV